MKESGKNLMQDYSNANSMQCQGKHFLHLFFQQTACRLSQAE